MEHNNVHDTKEARNKMNKKLTTVIAESKHNDTFLDENISFCADEDAQTELEDDTVIDK